MISMCLPPRGHRGAGFRLGLGWNMHNLLMVIVVVSMSWMHNAQAQSTTVDPESIVPLPDKFDMEMPEPDVSPDIARFQGAWIGTRHDDRHILVVERVKPDGHANVVFAQSDSAIYAMNREWWRDQATIADGVLTMTGFRTFRYAFDGPGPAVHDGDPQIGRRHLRNAGPHRCDTPCCG